MSKWKKIKTAPSTEEPILVGFQGQFKWVYFIAMAFGEQTGAQGYAAPTHWMPLPAPPRHEQKVSDEKA